MGLTVLRGTVFAHAETGTEGAFWCARIDKSQTELTAIQADRLAYGDLYALHEGDEVEIVDHASGEVLFEGTIVEDRETAFQKYPHNPEHGQPLVKGVWCHWTQKGVDPERWGGFFFPEKAFITVKTNRL